MRLPTRIPEKTPVTAAPASVSHMTSDSLSPTIKSVPTDVPKDDATFIFPDIILSGRSDGPKAMTRTTTDMRRLLSVYGMPINDMGAAASMPALLA